MTTINSVHFAPSSASAWIPEGPAHTTADVKAPEQHPATLKADSVELSLAAKIQLMHHHGLPASIIAAQLGMPVNQVNVYIPGSNPVAPAGAAPAVSPSQKESSPTATPVSTAPSLSSGPAKGRSPDAPLVHKKA